MTDTRLPHYVSGAPYDPAVAEPMTAAQERFYRASQWTLMWWKLRRHRMAVISGTFLLLAYLSLLFSAAIAPNELRMRHTDFLYAPPQQVHLFHEGTFVGPFVYGLTVRLDLDEMTPLDALSTIVEWKKQL